MSTEHSFRQAGAHTGADISSRFQIVGPLIAGASFATVLVQKDTLYAVPYFTTREQQLSRLGLDVNATTSGTQALVAIYTVGCWTLPMPSSLYASVAMNVSSANQAASAVLSMTMQFPSLFWLTCMTTGSVTLQGADTAKSFGWAFFGYDTTSLSDAYLGLVTSYQATLGAPITFPTAFTLTTSTPPAIGMTFT